MNNLGVMGLVILQVVQNNPVCRNGYLSNHRKVEVVLRCSFFGLAESRPLWNARDRALVPR